MNAWDHLPNAKLIDWVIADVGTNPIKWSDARSVISSDLCLENNWDSSWDIAWESIKDTPRKPIWTAARDKVWSEAPGVTGSVATSVILALVAYDDCSKYLDMDSEELKVWAKLSLDPACYLLLTMVIRSCLTFNYG